FSELARFALLKDFTSMTWMPLDSGCVVRANDSDWPSKIPSDGVAAIQSPLSTRYCTALIPIRFCMATPARLTLESGFTFVSRLKRIVTGAELHTVNGSEMDSADIASAPLLGRSDAITFNRYTPSGSNLVSSGRLVSRIAAGCAAGPVEAD